MFLLPRSETGEYLALDLGGTNFRVLLITMKDGRMVDEVKLPPLWFCLSRPTQLFCIFFIYNGVKISEGLRNKTKLKL